MAAQSLTKDIIAATAGSLGPLDETQRTELLAACDKLKGTLEDPLEMTSRILFGSQTHHAIALRLGVDLKIFDFAATKSASGLQVQVDELAGKTGAEPQLITRVMRMLTGMGFFEEVGPEAYAPTSLVESYTTKSPLSDVVIHFSSITQTLSKLPEYFEVTGYKNPDDAFDGPFQYAMGTKLHCFDWLKTKPRLQNAFNTVMGITRLRKGEDWFEHYPVLEKLRADSDRDVVLVDIGGGLGHGLVALRERFPALGGRLILQDLPVVIDDVKDLPVGCEAMAHDFFNPQPVKGAKAYFLRFVLHDWPDKQAKEILQNIRDAMDEKSVLLVSESTMPVSNVSLWSAQVDFSMMALFSALDRTERQFEELLESSGFELVKVWTPKVAVLGYASLFEAVRKG